MANNSNKVYVIDTPAPPKRSKQTEKLQPSGKAKKPARSLKQPRRSSGHPASWKQAVLAYVLGPAILPFKSSGRRRIFFSVIGPGMLALLAVLAVFDPFFSSRFETGPYGVLLWLVAVTGIGLSLTASWALAVSKVNFNVSSKRAGLAKRFRDPRCVTIMGILVPGSGLMISGHPKRAAWALWVLGLFILAAVVLSNWHWLWSNSILSKRPGISGNALEVVFLIAAGLAAASILAWIGQALDGARLVSRHRSNRLGDSLGAALLASIVLFVLLFQPGSSARQLHSAADALQDKGLLLIPLKLNEAAAALDSNTPAYLARAAELNEKMGDVSGADTKRQILQARAAAYSRYIPGEEQPVEKMKQDVFAPEVMPALILGGPPGGSRNHVIW